MYMADNPSSFIEVGTWVDCRTAGACLCRKIFCVEQSSCLRISNVPHV